MRSLLASPPALERRPALRDEDDEELERFARLLRFSASKGDAAQGRQLHAEILESKQHHSKYLRNLIVDMYGSLGRVEEARAAFDAIDRPNSFSWNILIKAYAQNGYSKEAMEVYARMIDRDQEPNAYTYASILGACSTLRDGEQIHERICESGLESQVVVGSALVSMYSRMGRLGDAKRCFDSIEDPNAVAWASMANAYALNGHLADAKTFFDKIPDPIEAAANTIIVACGRKGEVEEAKRIFDDMPQRDVVSETSMVVAYAANGHLQEAREVFDGMGQRNTVTWNAMLAAYIQHGKMQEARSVFDKMPQRDRVSLTSMMVAYARRGDMLEARRIFDSMEDRDIFAWNSLLSGYARNGHVEDAKEIFEAIPQKDAVTWNTMLAAFALNGDLDATRALFREMPGRDAISWNTLISCLACNGFLGEAKSLFDLMPCKNTVSWNAMILAFAENGHCREAISMLQVMDLEGTKCDSVTFIGVFDACASLGASSEGRVIHSSIIEAGFISNKELSYSLVNMYAKCGCLDDAKAVFDPKSAGVEAWNAMIDAYAQCGLVEDAVELFQCFRLQGFYPNETSFLRIISACSHAGMIDAAWGYFVSIREDYEEETTMDHFLCILDSLGRAGQLDEAQELIDAMPFVPDVIAWMSLLSASKVQGDMECALSSVREVVLLEPGSSSPYILLSNLYKHPNPILP